MFRTNKEIVMKTSFRRYSNVDDSWASIRIRIRIRISRITNQQYADDCTWCQKYWMASQNYTYIHKLNLFLLRTINVWHSSIVFLYVSTLTLSLKLFILFDSRWDHQDTPTWCWEGKHLGKWSTLCPLFSTAIQNWNKLESLCRISSNQAYMLERWLDEELHFKC